MSLSWRRIALVGLAMAATSSVAVAGGVEAPAPIALYAAPQTQARLPDGRRYNLVCMGEGGPVAVLDVGLRCNVVATSEGRRGGPPPSLPSI